MLVKQLPTGMVSGASGVYRTRRFLVERSPMERVMPLIKKTTAAIVKINIVY
jgi:hypothetical protein